MMKTEKQVVQFANGEPVIFCPGCQHTHVIHVNKPNHCKAQWTWNCDQANPTFAPSINIVGRCHFHVRNGRIEYCPDCTHGLAGQTVDMVELDPTTLQPVV